MRCHTPAAIFIAANIFLALCPPTVAWKVSLPVSKPVSEPVVSFQHAATNGPFPDKQAEITTSRSVSAPITTLLQGLVYDRVKPLSWESGFGMLSRRAPHISYPETLIPSAESSPWPNGTRQETEARKLPKYSAKSPFRLRLGERQLFFDDELWERMDNVQRVYHQATVVAQFPVQTSKSYVVFPWIDGVLRDRESGEYRMWHACVDGTSCVSLSTDGGVTWGNTIATQMEGNMTIRERGAVYEEEPGGSLLGVWYMHPLQQLNMHKDPAAQGARRPTNMGALYTFASDRRGLVWRRVGRQSSEVVGDASSSFYDPFRRRYFLIFKLNYLTLIRVQALWAVENLRDYPNWHDFYSRCSNQRNVLNPLATWRSCLREGDRLSQLHPLPLVDAHDPSYNSVISAAIIKNLVSIGTPRANNSDIHSQESGVNRADSSTANQGSAPPRSSSSTSPETQVVVGGPTDEAEVKRVTDAYTFHAFAYESFVVGITSVHSGSLANRPKVMHPCLAFSRGDTSRDDPLSSQSYPVFHRPPPTLRVPIVEIPDQGNIASFAIRPALAPQSPGGMDDDQYTYLYAATTPYTLGDDLRNTTAWKWPLNSTISTARLRRDGFVSLSASFGGSATAGFDARRPGRTAVMVSQWISATSGASILINVAGCAAFPTNEISEWSVEIIILDGDNKGNLYEKRASTMSSSAQFGCGVRVDTGMRVPRAPFQLRITISGLVQLFAMWVENK